MPRYTITEPHPTVEKNSYTHAGRGGAGNTFRAGATTASTGVPTVAPVPQASSGRFYSGRGGAGNVHKAAERQSLSVGDEYAQRVKASSSGHVGRGGAGNISQAKKNRKESDASTSSGSRRDSSSTAGSVRAGFWGRLSGISVHSN
jgi:hypothetical protein